MSKLISFFIGSLILTSCSFKPSDDDKNKLNRTIENLGTVEVNDPDSDGDGILDKEDHQPLLADVPVIGGEFFNNLDIKYLHRGEAKVINVLRNHKGTGSFFQFVSEMNSSSGDHIRSRLNSESLNVFTFKNPKNTQTTKIEETFSVVDRVFVEIDSELNFRYSRASSFSNLNIELYYYNSSRKELELVSSLILGDKFNFNEKTHKKLLFPISYSNPERIVNDRGRSLFVKFRDFTIIEQGESFASLMNSVLSKSLPLVISNGESSRYHFLSTKNKRITLSNALEKAQVQFKEERGAIHQVDSISNASDIGLDFFGNTIRDEKKWVVMTRNISTSHQSYTFGVGDFVYLNYVSKMNPQILRPRAVGGVGTSRKKTIHTAILKKDALDRSRIIFRPISFKGLVTDITKLRDCRWDKCFSFNSRFHQGESLEAMSSLYFVEMILNNKNYNLGQLLLEGKISLKKIDSKDLFEVVWGNDLKAQIKFENTFELSFNEYKGMYCDGSSYCSGINCENYFNSTPPNCSLTNFYKDYLFYETQLVRNMTLWDGGAYIGFESFE